MLGREERRQGRLCGSKPGPFGSATWSLFPLPSAWQVRGMTASRAGGCGSGGQVSIQAALWRARPRVVMVGRVRAGGGVFGPAFVRGGAPAPGFVAPPPAGGAVGVAP